MSLIEKLGGYEKAKEYLIELQKTPIHEQTEDTVTLLPDMLLEYRRKHNIYEVGDLVIKTHPKNTILRPVLGVYKNGGVWLDYKGFCWKPPRVRHATDAEIEAGKRLEVG